MILAAEQPEARDLSFFFILVGCILTALVGGYIGRRRGILNPAHIRRTMSAAIIGCDAPIALLAIWFLKMDADTWKVPVVGAIVGTIVCGLGLVLARWRRMPLTDAPIFGLQSGMGNVGYTFGGVVCFMAWGLQGLAVEQIFTMMWPFFAFLFCFPIARHYGELATAAAGGEAQPAAPRWLIVLRILRQSLLDLRSLPLYAATAGVLLNLANSSQGDMAVHLREAVGTGLFVPPREFVEKWHILHIVMIVGIFLQFGSIGMTVRASRILVYWKAALASAAMKFLVSPLVMLGLALAMGLGGMQLQVCVVLAAAPTAVYSILMANLFGLNKDLANTTFVTTHAIAFTVLIVTMVL
jgi:predicted permease